ncbi:MAG: ZIP family metal transporter [Actinomycetota bacterium]
MIRAAWWGFVAASALPIGAVIAMRWRIGRRTLGAVMAFGAGTLITAVTFELVDQAFRRADLWPVVAGLGFGAVAFTLGDAAIVRTGGRLRSRARHRPPSADPADGGLPILLGAVLDGVPESLVLGISLATGDAVSVTFVVAVFLSNVPEALASTQGLVEVGYRPRSVLGLWFVVAGMSAVTAGVGATLDGLAPAVVAIVQSFAGGRLARPHRRLVAARGPP